MKRTSMFTNVAFVCLTISSIMLTSCKENKQANPTNQHNILKISLTNKSLESNYSATITGRQCVDIRPQISGMITKVHISEGAAVKQGQILFIIDQTPYEAALQTAVANVQSAQAKVSTAKLTAKSKEELYKQNVVSEFDLQTAQNTLLEATAALNQAKAQELNARNNLSYTVVRSPVDGVSSMINYRVGALVNPSMSDPLVTVSDDAEMYAYFSMTENQILELSRQKGVSGSILGNMPTVRLRLSDGTVYEQSGKIDAISGIINPSTGAVSVRATFPNKSKMLRNGGTANIIFPYEKTNCIVIPQAATYEIQNKIFTYKVVDGKTVSTPITVFNVNDGKDYIVESGLQVGDSIVAEGAGLLQEGVKVSASTKKSIQG